MLGIERRKHSREKLYGEEQECMVFCLGKDYLGKVYDISKGGLCVEVEIPSTLIKGRCIEIQASYVDLTKKMRVVYVKGTIVYSDETSWGARVLGIEAHSEELTQWVEDVRTKRFASKLRAGMQAG